MSRFTLALFLGLIFASGARAAQGHDNCTGYITSVPAIISTQGTWCLKSDLATAITSTTAIYIAANNVTIDCNFFKLGGLAGGTGTTTIGIGSNGRSNGTVRHCNIRGFYVGVDFYNSGGGDLVEDNRLDGNTVAGIALFGKNSTARRNLVTNTGGYTGASAAVEDTDGIFASSADVIDNTVYGVAAASGGGSGLIFGIEIGEGSTTDNRVRKMIPSATGVAYGIFAGSPSGIPGRGFLRNNEVAGDGSVSTIGLHCNDATKRAKGNVVKGFAVNLEGCGDDGNVLVP